LHACGAPASRENAQIDGVLRRFRALANARSRVPNVPFANCCQDSTTSSAGPTLKNLMSLRSSVAMRPMSSDSGTPSCGLSCQQRRDRLAPDFKAVVDVRKDHVDAIRQVCRELGGPTAP
jgi:hypothetical protein